jgi:hypothetical protein
MQNSRRINVTQISRRKFITTGTMSAAALGTLAVLPGGAAGALDTASKLESIHTVNPNVVEGSHALAADAFVVYIPDPRSGKLHYMVGEKEIVRQNKKLVNLIIQQRN